MDRGVLGALALAALLVADAAEASAPTVHRVEPSAEGDALIHDAILGYCFRQVTGAGLVAETIDPTGPDWVAIQPSQTTNGLELFDAHANVRSSVIIDVAPEKVSCFVQGMGRPQAGVGEALRAEIVRRGGLLLDDQQTAQGRSTLYGFVREDSNDVPVVSINEYAGVGQGVITAVVKMGQKGSPQ